MLLLLLAELVIVLEVVGEVCVAGRVPALEKLEIVPSVSAALRVAREAPSVPKPVSSHKVTAESMGERG